MLAPLTLLDEVGVFCYARRVENYANPLSAGEFPNALQILERDRLAAYHVYGGGDTDVGNPLRSMFENDRLQLL